MEEQIYAFLAGGIAGCVIVFVALLMLMLAALILLRPEDFARQIRFAVNVNVQFGRCDSAAVHPRNLQSRSNIQCRNGVLEQLRRNPGIY